jgi:opacity protein-like surface antigen
MRYAKTIFLVSLVLSMVTLAPRFVRAEGVIDLYLGAAITQDEDVTARAGGAKVKDEADYDTSVSGGGRLGYWFTQYPWLGLSVGASYFAPEEEDTDIDVVPISFLLRLRYPEGKFHPYIGVGPALFYSNVDAGDFSDDSLDVGLDANAGLSVDFYQNFAIFGEYRFTYFSPEYKDNISGVNVKLETDFYTHHLLVGVSFYF